MTELNKPTVSRLDEFLAETASDLTPSQMKKALRSARSLVMECMTLVAPKPVESVRQTTTAPLDFGLELQRDLIVSARTDEDWEEQVLAGIKTAKRMGATNFEIELKEARQKYREQPEFIHPAAAMFGAAYGRSRQREDVDLVNIYAVRVK